MTAAAPIYWDTSRQRFAGVVSMDFSAADLDEMILGTSILDDGYAYVMAADGGAVIHQLLDRNAGAQSVAQIEQLTSEDSFIFVRIVMLFSTCAARAFRLAHPESITIAGGG